jgi:Holliday junction resolvasome RuvABC endonuclease subunit
MTKIVFSLDKSYKDSAQIIAGLDLSLRHSGIVILNSQGEVLHKESIIVKTRQKNKENIHEIITKVDDEEVGERMNVTTNGQLDDLKRIIGIKNRIKFILKNHKVTKVAIEGYSMGSRKGQIFNIAELGGLVKCMLYEEKYDFSIIPPKSLKSYITGNGNAEKEEMQHAILKKYFLTFEDNNEADAFGLAVLLLELGEEIYKYCQKNGPASYRKQIEPKKQRIKKEKKKKTN